MSKHSNYDDHDRYEDDHRDDHDNGHTYGDNDYNNDTGVHSSSSDDIGRSTSTYSSTAGREKYSFVINQGIVSAAYELEHGFNQQKWLDANERYQIDGNDILKIENKTTGQEITRYSDVDGNGLYAKVSEQWVSNGSTTVATPVIHDSLHYEGNEQDEHIGLNSDGTSFGGAGSDQFVFRQLGHMTVGDFNRAEGDKLVFDTGLGLNSLAQLLQYVSAVRDNGQETVIEFGDQVSLTLVGVQAGELYADDFSILS